MNNSSALSVITVDFRNKVRLAVNELAHQDAELEAALLDLTAPLRAKRVEAFKKLNEARRKARTGRQSTVFTTAAKNRFETAVFSLDVSHWSMENPPRMAVLKTPGSGMSKDMVPEAWGNRGFWVDSAPSYKAFMASFDKLQARYRVAFGVELDAPYGLQFQNWGNPHIHLWLTVPLNADGSERLAASPTGKGARNAKYNGLRLWEWLECNWADILGIRSDITSPEEHGVATWLARTDEVDPADSMEDYLGRAVGYIRLDNDAEHSEKRKQQVVPMAWRNADKPQQVNFWGVAGFTNKRKAADAPQRFEIHTKAAERAVFRYLAKLADAERTFKEIDGVMVETSFWSTDRTRLRGGTLDRPLTELEVLELRRIISFFNKVDEVVTTDPIVEVPPAPWEAVDFDAEAFSASLCAPVGDDQESSGELEPVEDIRPLSELLADSGFTPDEQAAALKTASRQARRAAHKAKAREELEKLRERENSY